MYLDYVVPKVVNLYERDCLMYQSTPMALSTKHIMIEEKKTRVKRMIKARIVKINRRNQLIPDVLFTTKIHQDLFIIFIENWLVCQNLLMMK